jgi:HD superfamily phosphodiesterase
MKCPGQDPRYWKFDAIYEAKCPHCGGVLEFFKDETRRRCKKCGEQVLNPKMDFGCATHCKFAKHCFGDLPPELIKQKQDLFKDRVVLQMKRLLKNDFKKIGHAAKVAGFAQQIAQQEGADPAIVITASYLHDLIPSDVDQSTKVSDDQQPEKGSVDIARELMAGLDAEDSLIEEVCNVIEGSGYSNGGESSNQKVFQDADLIAVLLEDQKKSPKVPEAITERIESQFRTESGKTLARGILLNVE